MDRFVAANGQIVRPDGREIGLTVSEAILLGRLRKHAQAHPGEYVNRQRQAVWLWGADYNWPETWASSIAVHHHRLRTKTGGGSFRIEHKYDFGDRFMGDLEFVGDLEGDGS